MSQNIIFLDIDGVLNSNNTFKENYGFRKAISKLPKNNPLEHQLYLSQINDLDNNKIFLIKTLSQTTNSQIVVISTWRNLRIWPLIEEYLVSKGLPITDVTPYIKNNRSMEISFYLKEHPNIKNFIIIDDDFFPGYEEYYDKIIHTSFYQDGFTEEHLEVAKTLLKK